MEERPVETLVERIDAALARIERAAARGERDNQALASRHERLKASVSDAMAELDTLIAGGRE